MEALAHVLETAPLWTMCLVEFRSGSGEHVAVAGWLTWLLRVLANGDLWIGATLATVALAAVDAAGALDRRPRTARSAGFAFLFCGLLGALGAPPLPLLLALPLIAAFGLHAFRGFHHHRPRVRRAAALGFAALAAAALAHEVPYALGPAPPDGPPPRTLIVLADSLTAGGYGESRTWPQILAEDDHLDVRDLSRDGQTVAKALAEIEGDLHGPAGTPAGEAGAWNADLLAGPVWVLVELGGNDVLGESSLASYTASLDRLLRLCRGSPRARRTVVMMEIPTVPGRWGFAAAQRRLAERHGVRLVPRRVLANVVFARGSTDADALHLTQNGQQRFADVIRPWLGLDDVSGDGASTARALPAAPWRTRQ